MVLEEQILPYFQWLLGVDGTWGALPHYFMIAAVLGLLALVVGYLISAARYGLLRGGDRVYRTVSSGFGELSQTSPRRVWALARQAIKEARRRRVEVALVQNSDSVADVLHIRQQMAAHDDRLPLLLEP